MNKILGFIKSPIGKFLLIAIVVVIVAYFSYMAYQKSIYNGKTKSEVEKGLIDKVGKDTVAEIKSVDTNFLNGTYPLLEILKWYDANQPTIINDVQLKNYLTLIGITADRQKDFSNLVGKPVSLVNYA